MVPRIWSHRRQLAVFARTATWPSNSVFQSCFVHWTPGLLLRESSKSVSDFNFDLDPVCKTCSWNVFEVSKNDLKKCVLEIAALL